MAIDWAKRRVRSTSASRRRRSAVGGEADVELARGRQPEREVERLRQHVAPGPRKVATTTSWAGGPKR